MNLKMSPGIYEIKHVLECPQWKKTVYVINI